MGDLSEASLLDYIYSCGGKVKDSDLLKKYKQFVAHGDLHLRAKYREDFKLIIDKIAVCKSENGEKYLVLKKKYKQLMQERESQPMASEKRPKIKASQVEWCVSPTITVTDVQDPDEGEDGEKNLIQKKKCRQELKSEPMASGQKPKIKTSQVEWCVGPTITVTDDQDPDEREDVTDDQGTMENQEVLTEENSEIDAEDDLGDLGSKSELEQEDESVGSVESAAVALDPIEKEWIYSAACGRLSHLTQLLKQDASLANKKDFTSTALHWAAKHGKEDMAVAMADAGADVNTKAGYTPLHIAALHGHMHIFDLLIQRYGAKENVRDYSGHLASHYLHIQKAEESSDLNAGYHSPAQVTERRNRKLTSLFHSRKKWGSAEDLAPVPEERSVSHQLIVPAFRPRKFSR